MSYELSKICNIQQGRTETNANATKRTNLSNTKKKEKQRLFSFLNPLQSANAFSFISKRVDNNQIEFNCMIALELHSYIHTILFKKKFSGSYNY